MQVVRPAVDGHMWSVLKRQTRKSTTVSLHERYESHYPGVDSEEMDGPTGVAAWE
jgi:hypothetical protein